MKLKLTVRLEGGRHEDVLVTADPDHPVGAIAAAIAEADPNGRRALTTGKTLRIEHPQQHLVLGSTELARAGLVSGAIVSVAPEAGQFQTPSSGAAAAILEVVAGPDKGSTYPLHPGNNQIGRGPGNDIRLSDPLVSKAHARVTVAEQIEVTDLGSANGVVLRGSSISRAVISITDDLTVGDTTFRIRQHDVSAAIGHGLTGAFNRSPRLDPEYEGAEFVAPTPPAPPQPGRFPVIPMLAPVLMAGLMFAITRNPQSVLFVALSPLMMLGSVLESRIVGKKAFEAGVQQFRAGLKDLEVQLHYACEQEGNGRRREHPSGEEVLEAVRERSTVLWTRRPDRRAFLDVRLGLGARSTRHQVKLPSANGTTPELWREVTDLPKRYAMVPDVPVTADLVMCGSVGLAGPSERVAAAARSALLQLAGLHSPSEVVMCALVAGDHQTEWDWLKWLPHLSSEHSPLGVTQSAVADSSDLVAALVGVVEQRLEMSRSSSPVTLPRVLVFVDDVAGFDRPTLVDVFERGAEVGVHAVWMAAAAPLLPAVCEVFLAFDGSTATWRVGDVRTGEETEVVADQIDLQSAQAAARALSPLVDSGAPVEDDSDIPRSVSLLAMVEPELAEEPLAIVDRWRASYSLPAEYARPGDGIRRSKDDVNLRAVVGVSASQPFTLDLRSQGPHALVGGTTGSGKSEFLQTWVLAMAAAHSPDRVNFLFVDYKGGAAFGDCVELPHSVGLVTDLSPYLVRRALTSLKAELRYREELFREHQVTDLVSFERKDIASAPPSLVIVVDEFAALATEVPAFVDGVVDVAQRGRSLGLHLILATQRPAGVIRDNLRANTNLRIALRMADEADSLDVVGTKQAALFEPIPGRAMAKMGPGRLSTFQTAYVGGWTSSEKPKPIIHVEELRLGGGPGWEPLPIEPTAAALAGERGANDLQRVVTNITNAFQSTGMAVVRKPWQAELAATYELARIRPSRHDRQMVFGILDDPENQAQRLVAFEPDRDGNVAVFGTGGSGKSAFLRTLAVSAGLSTEAPCHVYGLDFGSRGLQMLEPLPHVGSIIGQEDGERVARLLRTLRRTIDERARRFGEAGVGNLQEYRATAGNATEPRILLLLDGFAAFRAAYESGPNQAVYDLFTSIATDGRPMGVHVALSADRAAAVPGALGSNIQRRLVLRMAQDGDYGMFGVPADGIQPTSPPGRGFYDGFEVQVAVLGGQASTSRQATSIARVAAELRQAGRFPAADPIAKLSDSLYLADLPPLVDELPTLGVADETLLPIGFALDDPLLVAGPPQANRSAFVLSMVQSIARSRPNAKVALLSLRQSKLATAFPWEEVVYGTDAVVEFVRVQLAFDNGPTADGVVIENATDLANTSADGPLQELVKSLVIHERFVIADADSNIVTTLYGICQLLRAGRHGLALQPDQAEGDSIFRTGFPKSSRAEFPVGRGFYVRHGRAVKVQCAAPISSATE